jgi:rubrerythrin
LKEKGAKVDDIKVEAEVPAVYGTTAENLKAAIAGENYEHVTMYPEFAAVAKGEGLNEIALRLSAIGRAEEHHEERYLKILKVIEEGSVFKKETEVAWVCRECGYVHIGKTAPAKCPSCQHAQAFYQIKCEEY